MTTLNVKFPDSILKKAGELAAKDGESLDQFVSTAVAEKLSIWVAGDELICRSARASREKFDVALGQVPNLPPMTGDELKS